MQKLSTSDRLLLVMHNLGIIDERRSQAINELKKITKISSKQLSEILEKHEESGYVKSIKGRQGLLHYFLTGKGIIRVSSTFT
jgi:DNA-binding IscR family transcriptional regulator